MNIKRILVLAVTWIALSMALFPVGCTVSYVGLMIVGTRRQKQPVAGPVRNTFPLLIILPGKSPGRLEVQVVYQGDLDAFKQSHPQFSFLVPAGKDDEINRQLQELPLDSSGTRYFSIHVDVKRLPNARQEIHLDASPYDDAPNESWYEAGDKEFTPNYHKDYMPAALSFNAGIAAAPIGLLLGMLGAVGLMLRNERKRKKAEARAPGANST